MRQENAPTRNKVSRGTTKQHVLFFNGPQKKNKRSSHAGIRTLRELAHGPRRSESSSRDFSIVSFSQGKILVANSQGKILVANPQGKILVAKK